MVPKVLFKVLDKHFNARFKNVGKIKKTLKNVKTWQE